MSESSSHQHEEINHAALHSGHESATSIEDSSMTRTNQKRRRHGHRFHGFKFMLVAISYFFHMNQFLETDAFSLSPSYVPRPSSFSTGSCFEQGGHSYPFHHDCNGRHHGKMRMSSLADLPAHHESSSAHSSGSSSPSSSSSSARLSDFQRRMKGLIKRNNNGGVNELTGAPLRNGAPLRRTLGRTSPGAVAGGGERPENLRTVVTLEEYKEALDENRGKIIVVRFFATWCKACKAIQPLYYRMAAHYPELLFLEVPVTNQNANLHQGLGVPSLPYGHIYYPEAGLVEEMKISKKYFGNLVKRVRWYQDGFCGVDETLVPEGDEESDSCNTGSGDCD
mmetsp:Transcript_26264/g.53247  ORF Transcript_26264/g.53247 Transcript_26264/m.53247 type:complete len:337 (-) Transcript_26264:422-1432(-)